jgi:RHS repeat-associated protein
VFFDNFSVTHDRGRIIEENHYYAYGLKIAALSSKAQGVLENKFLYNGKELASAEFEDGSGLDWYEYGLREYDAQIGRFFRVDPLTDAYPYLTPYQYAGCEPIANTDLDGAEPENATVMSTPQNPIGLSEVIVTGIRRSRSSLHAMANIALSPQMAGTPEYSETSNAVKITGAIVNGFFKNEIGLIKLYDNTRNMLTEVGRALDNLPESQRNLLKDVLAVEEIHAPLLPPQYGRVSFEQKLPRDFDDGLKAIAITALTEVTLAGGAYLFLRPLTQLGVGYGRLSSEGPFAGQVIERGGTRRILGGGSFTQTLEQQAFELVQLNGGRNSVTIETPTMKIRFDLAGKAHAGVPTPHMQVYVKNFVNGQVRSITRNSKNAIPMRQEHMQIVKRYLLRNRD